MKKSSSDVNLDGVLLFGFLVNPEPLGIFALDLLRQDRSAPAATILEKMHQGLDKVCFRGTENIIGSNRWREGFSDCETRKLFLFENRYICIPVCQQSSSGTACGSVTDYFFVYFSLERLHH